nr:hypothetical protein [Ornithobacterium rhinotracheale]
MVKLEGGIGGTYKEINGKCMSFFGMGAAATAELFDYGEDCVPAFEYVG